MSTEEYLHISGSNPSKDAAKMMKHTLYIIAALFLLSCSGKNGIRIIVENSLDFERSGELVEVELAADLAGKSYVLKDYKGAEVPWQLSALNGRQAILFQVDIPPHSSVAYTLAEGKPAAVKPKTAARFVPERKDDFAWENDLAAYRMYGPALADENPSNGVDLWLKCTEEPVMSKFYADELERHVSYHENHGAGLDCYDVKHTAGAGGIAPVTDRIHIGDHYDHYEIVEQGELRSVFILTYDSVRINDAVLRERITITAEAGGLLNKGVVTYEGEAGTFSQLAAGITLHDGKGSMFTSDDSRIISYAEDAVSVSGQPQGRSYVGVYMPKATQSGTRENHLLAIAAYDINQPLEYYFGGGWSQWRYPSDESWVNALARFAQCRETPLKTSVEQH